MKKLHLLFAALICTLTISSFNAQAQKKKIEKAVYKVHLHCEDCKKEIESDIPFKKGVKDVEVDMSKNSVTVTYDANKTDSLTIQKAIEKLDFKVEEPNHNK